MRIIADNLEEAQSLFATLAILAWQTKKKLQGAGIAFGADKILAEIDRAIDNVQFVRGNDIWRIDVIRSNRWEHPAYFGGYAKGDYIYVGPVGDLDVAAGRPDPVQPSYDTPSFRLLCVTELDYDGPDIAILTISVAAPDGRVYSDLGVVVQRSGDGYTLTPLTSSIDDDSDGDDVIEWLQRRCDQIVLSIAHRQPLHEARDIVVGGLGLDALDWSILDAQYEQKRAA